MMNPVVEILVTVAVLLVVGIIGWEGIKRLIRR